MKIQTIELERLRPHPSNPRGKIKPEDVADLAQSIRESGLLSPLTVTRDPQKVSDYLVLAGCRRLAALRLLTESTAACVELATDEVTEETILLADNIHRADLDPILAGRLVAKMLAKPGATVDGVGKMLGKSVRWVASARALGSLSKAWIARREKDPDVARLPISDLALIAGLSEESQARLAKSMQQWDLEPRMFRQAIAAETLRLSTAPWDLEDASLDPKAGACSKCPKTSLGTPGLFEGTGEAGDLKTAVCRDRTCFLGKLGACVALKVAAARREHGPKLLLLSYAPGEVASRDAELDAAIRARKLEIAETWNLKKAKGKDGGVPAYVLGGKAAGTVIRVERARDGGEPAEKKSKPKAGEVASGGPNAEEKRRLARLKVVLRLCREHVLGSEAPAAALVLGLVRAYGFPAPFSDNEKVDDKRRQKVVDETDGLAAFVAGVWLEVRDAVSCRFETSGSTKDLQACEVEVRWLAEILKLPLVAFEATALEQVPEPRARGDVKPKAPAKVKGPRKSKAAAK